MSDATRDEFLDLVALVRPELHRYCARLTGSVVDGEDIVQESLEKAFGALRGAPEVPALRPWLFRIAHNTALDHLKRYERKHVESRADFEDLAADEDARDPDVVRAALSSFLRLPIAQRCAVILKDVLGHSLEETADTMGATIPAVKSALNRGRTSLREAPALDASPPSSASSSARHGEELHRLQHYASLFNARDWDAVKALVTEECRLDLVAKASRRGKEVYGYFGRYAAEPAGAHLAVGRVVGKPALLFYPARTTEKPAYFIFVEWSGDRIAFIRDYRYVPYVADDLDYQVVG